jgi:hypothetical protein
LSQRATLKGAKLDLLTSLDDYFSMGHMFNSDRCSPCNEPDREEFCVDRGGYLTAERDRISCTGFAHVELCQTGSNPSLTKNCQLTIEDLGARRLSKALKPDGVKFLLEKISNLQEVMGRISDPSAHLQLKVRKQLAQRLRTSGKQQLEVKKAVIREVYTISDTADRTQKATITESESDHAAARRNQKKINSGE